MMDSLHIPLKLVDEPVYSSVRLRVRIVPDLVSDCVIAPQLYASCYDLVAALDAAFGAMLNGGRVEIDEDGRVMFSAFALFAFAIGDGAEESALVTPLLTLLGFDPNDCTEYSFTRRASRRADQMWPWPSISPSDPQRLEVSMHAAQGAHGGGCGVHFGAARAETLRMDFMDEATIRDWRLFFDTAISAPYLTIMRSGENGYSARPVVDDKRLEAAQGKNISHAPAHWNVRLTLMREVAP
jgi:hypothetical protein